MRTSRGTGPVSGPKVVVVTGASSGIGRGAALALARRGDSVVLAARGSAALEEAAEECRALGARALAVPTDVSDAQAVQALVQAATVAFGRIDAWVNLAAVWSYGTFEDTPPDVFRQVVETTLFGQVHAARAVLPVFRRQGHGVLVNVASLYGRLASPYVSPYVTGKWGVVGFSDVLRQELRDAPGIKVSVVLPGAIDTPIYRHAANYVGREIRPLPPVTSVDRAVDTVVRAVDRPKAQYVVGQAHHVGAWAYQHLPRVYDRVIGPVVRTGALKGEPVAPHAGNVFEPDPRASGVDDGWQRHDRRRVGRGLAGAAAGGAVVAWVRRSARRDT